MVFVSLHAISSVLSSQNSLRKNVYALAVSPGRPSRPSQDVPVTRVSGWGGSESEDEVEELLEVRVGGADGKQAAGGGSQVQSRQDGLGEFVSNIRRTVQASERAMGLEDPNWSGCEVLSMAPSAKPWHTEGLIAEKEVRDRDKGVETDGLSSTVIRRGSVSTPAGLEGPLETLLPRQVAEALGTAVSVKVAKAVSQLGAKAVSQRLGGAGGSAMGATATGGSASGDLAGGGNCLRFFGGPVFQQATREEGPWAALGGVVPAWASGMGLASQVRVPYDVELNLDIRDALAGMSKAQIPELVQSRIIVGLDIPMIKFDPHVVVKPLKKVVLDVDGFSLAEDAVASGWNLLVLVFYPNGAKELDRFHDEVLQTTNSYGWAAASAYEIQKRSFVHRFPMLRLTDEIPLLKERCLFQKRMLAVGANVVRWGDWGGPGKAFVGEFAVRGPATGGIHGDIPRGMTVAPGVVTRATGVAPVGSVVRGVVEGSWAPGQRNQVRLEGTHLVEGAGISGDPNGGLSLVMGLSGVVSTVHRLTVASGQGWGGGGAPGVVPARVKVLGIPSPPELPFTASHCRVARYLLYPDELTVDFPNQPLRNFLFRGLARGFALPAVFPAERHVVVSNHASAVSFHPTAADQLRVNSAQELALGRRLGPFTVEEVQQFPVFSNAPRERPDVMGLLGTVSPGQVNALLQMVAALPVGCILWMVDAKAGVPAISAPRSGPAVPGCVVGGDVVGGYALIFGMRDAVAEGMEDRMIAQVHRVFGLVGYHLKLEVLFGTAIRMLGFLVNKRALTLLTAQRVLVMAGTLTWVCQILPQGRVYLSNVYGLLGSVDPQRRVVVPLAVREDLEWFADTLLEWAGLSLFGSRGAGGPNVGACHRRVGFGNGWGEILGQYIQWHTDNANNVAVFEKGYGSTQSCGLRMVHVGRVNVDGCDRLSGECRGFPGPVPRKRQREVVLPGLPVAVGEGCVGLAIFMQGVLSALSSHHRASGWDWSGIQNHESVRQALANVGRLRRTGSQPAGDVYPQPFGLAAGRSGGVSHGDAGVMGMSSPGKEFEGYAVWLPRKKTVTAFTQYLLFRVGLPGLDGTGALRVLLALGACVRL
ncbi:hypothetical protein BC829DRAFT_444309 [Chytridium lagenaria]|nr:hypothetical protein BC829DRAFT_444309 [Chytridium lagenaria]